MVDQTEPELVLGLRPDRVALPRLFLVAVVELGQKDCLGDRIDKFVDFFQDCLVDVVPIRAEIAFALSFHSDGPLDALSLTLRPDGLRNALETTTCSNERRPRLMLFFRPKLVFECPKSAVQALQQLVVDCVVFSTFAGCNHHVLTVSALVGRLGAHDSCDLKVILALLD